MGLRRIEPPYINRVLFAAMNEAWLLSVGEEADPMRTNVAIREGDEWYVGDGWIKDGESFHFDYYGAYVMHPMLLEILEVLERHDAPFWNGKPAALRAQALKRLQRYGEQLEPTPDLRRIIRSTTDAQDARRRPSLLLGLAHAGICIPDPSTHRYFNAHRI